MKNVNRVIVETSDLETKAIGPYKWGGIIAGVLLLCLMGQFYGMALPKITKEVRMDEQDPRQGSVSIQGPTAVFTKTCSKYQLIKAIPGNTPISAYFTTGPSDGIFSDAQCQTPISKTRLVDNDAVFFYKHADATAPAEIKIMLFRDH